MGYNSEDKGSFSMVKRIIWRGKKIKIYRETREQELCHIFCAEAIFREAGYQYELFCKKNEHHLLSFFGYKNDIMKNRDPNSAPPPSHIPHVLGFHHKKTFYKGTVVI